ncbi:MAG: helix-turn-helix domain-containing protein [Acidimicrobiia bacterium]
MYTVEEAASLVGVARSTMYELVRLGEVASVKLGGRRFVTGPTIEAITGVKPPTPAELVGHGVSPSAVVEVPTPTPTPTPTTRADRRLRLADRPTTRATDPSLFEA